MVIATGGNTEIGRIGGLLEAVQAVDTPLTRKLDVFARQLTVAVVGLAGAILAFGLLVHGYSARDMFMAAVGIAVAAIPEGLPAIMTIALAVGVKRMARRHAIIRHLPSVETLGSVRIICTDKTGTLTRNEMTVRSVAVAQGVAQVTGTGYAPEGGLSFDGGPVPSGVLEQLRTVAARRHALQRGPAASGGRAVAARRRPDRRCSAHLRHEARPRRRPGRCRASRGHLPFESERQYMVTLHARSGRQAMLVKGAIERVLPMCTADATGALDAALWHQRLEQIAGQGQRVLAIAPRTCRTRSAQSTRPRP